MLPLKIRCPNCDNKGEIRDKSKFSVMGKQEEYSVTECRKCGLQLAYKIPVFKRYGFLAIGLIFIILGKKEIMKSCIAIVFYFFLWRL